MYECTLWSTVRAAIRSFVGMEVIPPTAKQGVLDEFSKPYKRVPEFELHGKGPFGVFFAHV